MWISWFSKFAFQILNSCRYAAGNAWNYLTVELKHLYTEGDPDLYGGAVNKLNSVYP
jgi:hypothetical protein